MKQEFEQDERQILEVLGGAGWERTEQSLSLGTASLLHDNGAMVLEVEQEYGQRELLISITSPDGSALTLFADYGDHLGDLLESIIESQDTIGPDDFQDHVRRWLAACPTIYYQQDEDSEPKRLTAD